MAYLFSVSPNSDGSSAIQFLINPVSVEGIAGGERKYTSIPTIDGSPILQFPVYDTSIKSFSFDIIAEENQNAVDFIFGTSEADITSLMYLKKLDGNSQMTLYYLNIPSELERIRPYSYRATSWIPVKFTDIVAVPSSPQGKIRWTVSAYFFIVPPTELP